MANHRILVRKMAVYFGLSPLTIFCVFSNRGGGGSHMEQNIIQFLMSLPALPQTLLGSFANSVCGHVLKKETPERYSVSCLTTEFKSLSGLKLY